MEPSMKPSAKLGTTAAEQQQLAQILRLLGLGGEIRGKLRTPIQKWLWNRTAVNDLYGILFLGFVDVNGIVKERDDGIEEGEEKRNNIFIIFICLGVG